MIQAEDSLQLERKDSLIHIFELQINKQEKATLVNYLLDNFDTTEVKISIILSKSPQNLKSDSCFIERLAQWKNDSIKNYGFFIVLCSQINSYYLLAAEGWRPYLNKDFQTQLYYKTLIKRLDSDLYTRSQFIFGAILDELKKDLLPQTKAPKTGINTKNYPPAYEAKKGATKPSLSLPFHANFGILMLWFLGIIIYLSIGLYLFFAKKKQI